MAVIYSILAILLVIIAITPYPLPIPILNTFGLHGEDNGG